MKNNYQYYSIFQQKDYWVDGFGNIYNLNFDSGKNNGKEFLIKENQARVNFGWLSNSFLGKIYFFVKKKIFYWLFQLSLNSFSDSNGEF